MFPGKVLVTLLLFGWRVARVCGPLFLHGHLGNAVEAASFAEGGLSKRSRYLDGFAWTTLLTVLAIGVPLAMSDHRFMAAHQKDFNALADVIERSLPNLPQIGWRS